jgi:hypothetical protein
MVTGQILMNGKFPVQGTAWDIAEARIVGPL